MTRDDIIRMAREVGFVAYGEDAGEYRIPTPAFHNRLERFAALVAAAEREACAKTIDEMHLYGFDDVREFEIATLQDAAKAIRARGQA
jgi:hypothetical protein